MFDAYYNGFFAKRDDIRIPLTDRSIFFGDAVYDAAIGRNGKIFMINEHLARLFRNAESLNIPIGMSIDELKDLLFKLVKLSDPCDSDYFLYIQLSRHSETRTHSYKDTNKSNLLITVNPITLFPSDKRLKLVSYPDIRYELCDIKTVNLIPTVIASKYADKKGADEAVFVRGGVVTECAHSNIHIIKDEILYTHPKNSFILPGIAREHLLSVCEKEGVKYREIAFTPEEMMNADQVLVTSSSKICLVAESFDGAYYGEKSKDLTLRILSRMRNDYYCEMG